MSLIEERKLAIVSLLSTPSTIARVQTQAAGMQPTTGRSANRPTPEKFSTKIFLTAACAGWIDPPHNATCVNPNFQKATAMHAITVPPMDRTLGALSNILTRAEAHCAAKNIKPEALLNFRLFPDMLPITKRAVVIYAPM